jgi:hypothetical protein
LTLELKVPLLPLSDTNLTVPCPQCPESLMSDDDPSSHMLSKASQPFNEKLSDEA